MNAAEGGIVQVAFIVRDLDATVADFARDLDVGPWTIVRNLKPVSARLYHRPATPELSVGLAYSGSMMIELIEEHGEVGLPPVGARSDADCRFHHMARTSTDFATDRERLLRQGRTAVFEASLPAELGGGRFAYFDNPKPLPGYLELVELAPDLTALFANLRSAAEQWDRHAAVIDADALLGAGTV